MHLSRSYNHSLKHYSRVCCFCSESAANRPLWLRPSATRQKATGSAFPYARIPLFRLFYQVEIRYLPNSLIEYP
jgi:hypothetical protein